MADILSTQARRLRMAAVRQKNTEPEIAVRSLLHRAGLRFRLQAKHLPGSPDIILPRWRTAVFVHGCFWHGHDCGLFRLPSTRRDWWEQKIIANRERDLSVTLSLPAKGWRVVTVWQCALKGVDRLPKDYLSEVLLAAVRGDLPTVDVRGRTKGPEIPLE